MAPKAADAGGNNIKVAVRIRPFNGRECAENGGVQPEQAFSVRGSSGSVSVVIKEIADYVSSSEYTRPGRTFNFDEVFVSTDKNARDFATQESVFEGIGNGILENALDAYNGCLLAYGQTGAGKSHSIMGDISSEEEKGLLPRACERLFEMVERRTEAAANEGTPMQCAILASYLEIYQEKLFDLLVSTRNDLQVRLHKDLGPHVPGLTQTPVQSIKEIHDLLDFGAKNRVIGATSMNASSSRSHAVFTIDLRIALAVPGGSKDFQSKVNFVDLAGSEKQKKTGATGDRLQEGISINQSLSALSRVIQSLSGSAGKGVQPPFRESKLTLLLKDALSGNSRTVLLACCSPSGFNLEESVSTLEFAARCKMIKTNAKKNEQDKREIIESLTAEKEAIESQLAQESEKRLVLQQQLEKEMEEAKKAQELAEKMAEEKNEIERQLRELEENGNAKISEEELAKHEAAQQALREENEKSKQKELEQSKEMERIRAEQEKLASEAKAKEEEMMAVQAEKERKIAEEAQKREEALKALEDSAKAQEEEQKQWLAKQEETERKAKELEDRLAKQTETDAAERKRLEEERAQIQETLEQEKRETEARYAEAERVRLEKEATLDKVNAEREEAAKQLEELRVQQETEKKRHDEMVAEKEQQAQALQALQEQAEADRRTREELEQREAERVKQMEEQLARLGQESDAVLKEEESKRLAAVNELQEKLDELSKREESQKVSSAAGLAAEAELRVKIQEEVRKRKIREEALENELKGVQDLSDSLALEKADLETKAAEQKNRREKLLEELGIHGLEDGEDMADVPRLVNLHSDVMLRGKLVYYLATGATKVGSDPQNCRVYLTGLDVADQVCCIDNVDNETLMVSATEGGFLRLNGKTVDPSSEALQLHHGDRLAVGRAHLFCVHIPKAKNAADDDSEERFDVAMKELLDKAELDPKWRRAVDDAVMIVKRDFGTSSANELLDQAKIASETVAHANALLKEVPQDWADNVAYYEMSVMFESDGPPLVCVVARENDQGRKVSRGIWEASRFKEERLPYMEQAIGEIQGLRYEEAAARFEAAFRSSVSGDAMGPRRSREPTLRSPTVDDWQSYAWSEVSLYRYNQLLSDHLEVKEDLMLAEEAIYKGYKGDEHDKSWFANLGLFKDRLDDPSLARKATMGSTSSSKDDLGFFGGLFAWKSSDSKNSTLDSKQSLAAPEASAQARTPSVRARPARDKGSGEDKQLLVPRRGANRARSVPGQHPSGRGGTSPSSGSEKPGGTPRRSQRWPAGEDQDPLTSKIVVPRPKATGRSRTLNELLETAEIEVPQLFDGKLGVRLRMENLVVTGFDVPRAAELGWRVGDEIVAVKGRPVRSKEDFRRELLQARSELPIVFTVARLRGTSSASTASPAGASDSSPRPERSGARRPPGRTTTGGSKGSDSTSPRPTTSVRQGSDSTSPRPPSATGGAGRRESQVDTE